MTALARAEAVAVTLDAPDDSAGFRTHARRLATLGVPPEAVTWTVAGETADLFGGASPAGAEAAPDPGLRVPRAFAALVETVVLHRDPARFALLYRLLWRLQRMPRLLEDEADPDVRRAEGLAKQVRRDIHKMRAFLRFRAIPEVDGEERFVAWFEPEHHILRANARFFVDRFASMRWSILTPQGTLHWDGASLQEGPPATRADAPEGDPLEAAWRRYYGAIFNPARLKIGAMLKEMPRRYWHLMPETAAIPALVAAAQARESTMVASGAGPFADAVAPASLDDLAQGIAACRGCAIGCNGTRAVPGEGNPAAQLMILGEQPGDNEEMQSRPFVGPAGQLLDRHLATAGIDRSAAWLTNAVKHFKHQRTGKRRLHQNPTAGEIDTCRWWLDHERKIVAPTHILALGASAGRALLGRTPAVARERGRAIALEGGVTLWQTVHPSYLLRLDGAAQARETANFAADLAALAAAL